MEKKRRKEIVGKEISCRISVLKDCVEENDFFSIFFNAKIKIKKITKKNIVIELLGNQQQIEIEYLPLVEECINEAKTLEVVLNDMFHIISIKKSM